MFAQKITVKAGNEVCLSPNQFMLATIGQCSFSHNLFDSSAKEELVTLSLHADIMSESLAFVHFNIFFFLFFLPLLLVTCNGD